MSLGNLLEPYLERVKASSTLRWQGRVTHVLGQAVTSEGPFSAIGELCQIESSTGPNFPGEIVGFAGSSVLSMPLQQPIGIRYGDRVRTWGARPQLRVGP